jgi:hypothetical protein
MKTFFNILQSLLKVKIKLYPDEPFDETPISISENSKIGGMINILIQLTYYKIKNDIKTINPLNKHARAKLLALNEITDNLFITKDLKEDLIQFFSTAQKHYFAFMRFANIYKYKKNKIVVTDDLSLNPLDPKHGNTFILSEKNANYLFSLNDLISIIETAIGHAPNFFHDPIWPENPYNKEKLSVSTLYNIYFKMKHSGRIISMLFHFLFLENFDIHLFIQKYEPFIRENSIKKFIFNSPYTILHKCVLDMLKENRYTRKLEIDNLFPKNVLVDIFRPFLYYYYIIQYDIRGTTKIYQYKNVLHYKLRRFYEYNKAFGRKYVKVLKKCKKIISNESEFNTKHISFYNICIEDLLNDSNNYSYTYFYRQNEHYDDYYDDNEENIEDDRSEEETYINEDQNGEESDTNELQNQEEEQEQEEVDSVS